MSIYLNNFNFVAQKVETNILHPRDLTAEEITNGVKRDFTPRYVNAQVYPFEIFPAINLEKLEFDNVTILYGDNGCGKTTVLNIIAKKLGINHESLTNTSSYFNKYVEHCDYTLLNNIPFGSKFVASDDVFNHIFETREFNNYLSETNENIAKKYDEETSKMELFKDRRRAEKNRNRELKKRFIKEQNEFSNGESAMNYFLDRIKEESLYLLDEPENSLSIENQIELSKYISDAARYFNSQFIIATHSPFFASIPGATVYSFEEYSVEKRKWSELDGMQAMFDFFESHREEFV